MILFPQKKKKNFYLQYSLSLLTLQAIFTANVAEYLISQTKAKLFSQNKETIGITKIKRTPSVSKQNARFSTFHIRRIFTQTQKHKVPE